MLPLTLCEWKCWRMKILSDVQPSFSCRWLQKPKVTILLITKIRISFEKLWPRFCIWRRLKRCLLFSAKKEGVISNVATLVSPKRFFFLEEIVFCPDVQMWLSFYVGYLYKAIYSYSFRSSVYECLFPDFGSSLRRLVSKMSDWPSWLDGEVLNPWCSLFAAGSKHRGPAMCRMCALISDEAVPWTGRSFCPCFFWHVYFPSIRRCSSPSFPSGGVMEYGEGGCVLEQFGSDFLKQLISAGTPCGQP